MKSFFALLSVCVLCGCQTPRSQHARELEDTRKIGSEEIARLPSKLRYSELVRSWGPGVAADPFYLYQSKIDGIILGVFVNLEASDPFSGKPEDGEVTEMYFMDMKDLRIHAWGDGRIFEINKRKKPE